LWEKVLTNDVNAIESMAAYYLESLSLDMIHSSSRKSLRNILRRKIMPGMSDFAVGMPASHMNG
jgi:hypothetical protein